MKKNKIREYEAELENSRAAFVKLREDSMAANEPLSTEAFALAECRFHNASRALDAEEDRRIKELTEKMGGNHAS